MAEPFPDTPPSEKPSEDRLDSWKEIAAYLGRDVTTVQRWEKREAMPVHRHVHDKRGSVYALAPELDAWLQSRRQRWAENRMRTSKHPKPAHRKSEPRRKRTARAHLASSGGGWCTRPAGCRLRHVPRPRRKCGATQNQVFGGTAFEEPVWRSSPGIPERRDDRSAHRTPLHDARTARYFPHIGDAIQESAALGAGDRQECCTWMPSWKDLSCERAIGFASRPS